MNGTQWHYFSFPEGLLFGQTYDFELSCNFPMDVYIHGNPEVDPTPSNYTTAFKS